MPKEAPAPPKAEVPKWVMTYADMVSLLVTFFIMLMTWSSLEKEMYSKMMGSVAGAFGAISDPQTRPREAIRDPPPSVKNRIPEHGMRNPRTDLTKIEEQARVMVQKKLGEKIDLQQTEQGVRIVLRASGQFHPGSDFLNAEARQGLRTLADFLRIHDYEALVVGHCWNEDTGGESVDVLDLSAQRAVAAAEFLRSTGRVPAELLKVGARGDSAPLYPDDPLLEGSNRRIELLLLPRPDREEGAE